MTDAALAVTERAVERFTEAYLTSLGANIRKDGRRWTVSLPDDADTELELDEAVLEVARDPDEVAEEALAVAPESRFVERLLDEAADRTPLGALALTGEQIELQLPSWITSGPVDVTSHSFTPYYDRRAVCALFHVGIETVSEYQNEELRAVAVDLDNHELRPRLAETVLELTESDESPDLDEGTLPDERTLKDALEASRNYVEEEIGPSVRQLRERATRAAEVEFDEYREFVRQRRDEIQDDVAHLTERVEEVTETIETASEQADRVSALRERKELQSELDSLRSELEDLTEEIEAGCPEKRREIRDRHALSVRIRPVTATSVTYERGKLELSLRTPGQSATVSYAYAVGAGVMETPECERCGQQLTADNPLTLDGTETVGTDCCGQ